MEFLAIFLFIGFICFVFGIYKVILFNKAIKEGSVTIGVIREYVEECDPETGHVSLYPVVYYSVNNCVYKTTIANGKIGEEKRVFYDKDKPNRAVVEGNGGVGYIVIGIIIMFIFIYLKLFSRTIN